MEYIVYFHRNPSTYQIFYIGIATRIDRAKYFSNRNNFWKSYVDKHGSPIIEILGFYSKERAENIERSLIWYFGRRGIDKGGILVNQSKGGGLHSGWKMPEHAKIAIKEKLRNKAVPIDLHKRMKENNPAKTSSVREKIRKSKLGHVVSDETKRKLSINSSARRPEVAAKISEALKGRTGSLHVRSRKVIQFNVDGSFISFHEGISEAARNTGADFRLISACCVGKRKTHKGFIWKYAE